MRLAEAPSAGGDPNGSSTMSLSFQRTASGRPVTSHVALHETPLVALGPGHWLFWTGVCRRSRPNVGLPGGTTLRRTRSSIRGSTAWSFDSERKVETGVIGIQSVRACQAMDSRSHLCGSDVSRSRARVVQVESRPSRRALESGAQGSSGRRALRHGFRPGRTCRTRASTMPMNMWSRRSTRTVIQGHNKRDLFGQTWVAR